MQKKLLIFLAVLVVGLFIANVVVLNKLLQKWDEKKSTSEHLSQPIPVKTPTAPASAGQGLFSKSLAAFSTAGSKSLTEEDSIGTQAGKTAVELQRQTEESYAVLNQQAMETAAELEKTSQEAMKVFNEQASKTVQEVQLAWADVLQKFNVELERFNEELRKKRTS